MKCWRPQPSLSSVIIHCINRPLGGAVVCLHCPAYFCHTQGQAVIPGEAALEKAHCSPPWPPSVTQTSSTMALPQPNNPCEGEKEGGPGGGAKTFIIQHPQLPVQFLFLLFLLSSLFSPKSAEAPGGGKNRGRKRGRVGE